MKPTRIALAVLVAGALAVAGTARAEGWSLGKLVPFAKKDNKPKRTTTYGPRSQESTLEKIGDGTKKVVTTTADLVTLKWLVPKKKEPPKPQPYTWHEQAQEKTSGSLFGSWFAPKEPEKPMTLKEWMAQKRLDP